MGEEFVFVDRYDALGMPHPDPETVCVGQCEGIGVVPVFCFSERMPDRRMGVVPRRAETDPRLVQLWIEAEKIRPAADGWHFVKCPDCDGTGKKKKTGLQRVNEAVEKARGGPAPPMVMGYA